MTPAHTPWSFRKALTPDNTGGFDWCVTDTTGAIIAEAFENVAGGPQGYTKRPAEDLARLISIAPDLLAACDKSYRLLAFRLDMADICDDEKLHWAELRALIARATGESP